MPRTARKIIVIVLLVQVAWSLPLAVFMGNLWLTSDEPNISYACDDGATCYSGPTTYLILMLVFGGIGLAVLVVVAMMLLRWRRKAGLRAHLLVHGLRTPALLVEAVPTNTEINDRRVYKLIFESRATGRPIRVVERAMTPLPIGTQTTIAYDHTDPTRAVLVEDIEALTANLQQHYVHVQQVHVNRLFAQQPFAQPPARPMPAPSAPPAEQEGGINAMRDAVARNLETALAELRDQVETGRITQAEYDEQRAQWMRLLETRTDRPLSA